jgi:hypothetical protein
MKKVIYISGLMLSMMTLGLGWMVLDSHIHEGFRIGAIVTMVVTNLLVAIAYMVECDKIKVR